MSNIIKIKKQYELLNILILGIFLILIGIILIFQSKYFGSIFIIFGFLIVTFKKGILIDTELKKIKYFKKFAFILFGDYSDISDIQYIALVRVNLTQQMNAASIPGTFSDVQVKLNIIMNDKRRIELIADRKNRIMPLAEQIAKGFDVNIYDNSEGKKLWINYRKEEKLY